jgi:hypothetical protein
MPAEVAHHFSPRNRDNSRSCVSQNGQQGLCCIGGEDLSPVAGTNFIPAGSNDPDLARRERKFRALKNLGEHAPQDRSLQSARDTPATLNRYPGD